MIPRDIEPRYGGWDISVPSSEAAPASRPALQDAGSPWRPWQRCGLWTSAKGRDDHATERSLGTQGRTVCPGPVLPHGQSAGLATYKGRFANRPRRLVGSAGQYLPAPVPPGANPGKPSCRKRVGVAASPGCGFGASHRSAETH